MIAILLATYNGEKYIRDQIDSILCQSFSAFRLYISDDCSTDKTLDILNEYVKKDNRVHVVSQKENIGHLKNFEYLLRNVKEEIIFLSDQDDVWYKNKIEKTLNFYNQNNVSLVHTDLEVVDEKLSLINKSMFKGMNLINNRIKGDKFSDYILENRATGCTMCFHREILDTALPFNKEMLVHDWWLALCAFKYRGVKVLNEPTIKYRQHNQNTIGYNSLMKLIIFVFKNELIKRNSFKIYITKKNEFLSFCNSRPECFNQVDRNMIREYYDFFVSIYKSRPKIIEYIKIYRKQNMIYNIYSFYLIYLGYKKH